MNTNQPESNNQPGGSSIPSSAWALFTLVGLLLLFIGVAFILTYYPPSLTSSEVPKVSKNPTLKLANGNAIPVVIPPTIIDRSFDLDSLVELQANEKTGISKGWTEFTVPPGHLPVAVKLPDGSRVELNAGTTLRFPTQFSGDKREVFLDGEALFDVIHNARRPFIVRAKEVDVKVIGTAFNINNYTSNKKTQVSLLSGGVLVFSKGSEKQLEPGQAAIYDRSNSDLSIELSFDKEQTTSWRQGRYFFSNKPLGEVCEVVFRMYGIKINVPQALASKPVSGYLDRKQNISAFFEDLKIAHDIAPEYDKAGNITLREIGTIPK